jgi:pimeloyl-ACP methyl ester carboxylesterase
MYSYEKLRAGANTYEIYRFGTEGKPDMLFMPGFSLRPHYYERMFRNLEGEVNGVSAKIIGLYHLEKPPVSLEEMAADVCTLAENLFDGPFGYGGHSTGATAGLIAARRLPVSWLCLFSPLISLDHSWLDLWIKAAKLGIISMADLRKTPFSVPGTLSLALDVFRDINHSIDLTDSLAGFDYWPISTPQIPCNTKIIFAEKDEFGLVPDDYNLERLQSLHSEKSCVEFITLNRVGHLWPITYPRQASMYIKEMVDREK